MAPRLLLCAALSLAVLACGSTDGTALSSRTRGVGVPPGSARAERHRTAFVQRSHTTPVHREQAIFSGDWAATPLSAPTWDGLKAVTRLAVWAGLCGAALLRLRRPVPAEEWAALSVDGEAPAEERTNLPGSATPAFNKVGQEREMDSQYRKLRLLFYFGIGVFSGVSALVYTYFLAQLALQGGGEEGYSDILADVIVNLLAFGIVNVLYRIDKVPEEKLLVRTEEGGALATLRIRFEGEQLLLGAMRRQDGKKGRRVVILACNPAALQTHLLYLQPQAAALAARDLLVVPVALPMTRATTIDHTLAYRGLDRLLFKGPHVAVPNGGDWVSIFGTECDKAVAAGVLPVETGFALLIERDGRVGRRLPGLPSVEELLELQEA